MADMAEMAEMAHMADKPTNTKMIHLNPPEPSEEVASQNVIVQIKVENSSISIEDLVMDELTRNGALA